MFTQSDESNWVRSKLPKTGLSDKVAARQVAEAFLKDQITIGHPLLVAKLPASQQQEAFSAAFRASWTRESAADHTDAWLAVGCPKSQDRSLTWRRAPRRLSLHPHNASEPQEFAMLGDEAGLLKLLKLLFDPGTHRLLGVHALGQRATEIHPHWSGGTLLRRISRIFPGCSL
jgi:hypothetical protein